MTLQYARLFQLRAGLSLIGSNGSFTKGDLQEELRKRKSIGATEIESTEGADDIIEQLRDAYLIIESDAGYRLSNHDDIAEEFDNSVLLFAGEEVVGAGDERSQADRILANLMYRNPMLIQLAKFVHRNAPVKKFEILREFDGEAFLGDKMNAFTIEMGLDLLGDAGVVERSDSVYKRGRWPVRLFAHIVHEEYFDLGGDEGGGVREPDLFERLQTLYGIDGKTFDRLLNRLKSAGIVSEASYEELILKPNRLDGAKIHE